MTEPNLNGWIAVDAEHPLPVRKRFDAWLRTGTRLNDLLLDREQSSMPRVLHVQRYGAVFKVNEYDITHYRLPPLGPNGEGEQ